MPRLLRILAQPTVDATDARRLGLAVTLAAVAQLPDAAAWVAAQGGLLAQPNTGLTAPFWSIRVAAWGMVLLAAWRVQQAFCGPVFATPAEVEPQTPGPAPRALPAGVGEAAILGVSCADCFSEPLYPLAAARGTAVCVACSGALVGSAAAPVVWPVLRITEETFRLLVQGGEGRDVACPECEAPVRMATLRGAAVRACGACRALWLRRGALYELTSGGLGLAGPNLWANVPPPPEPAPTGLRLPAPVWALAFVPLGLVVSVLLRAQPSCGMGQGWSRYAVTEGVASVCEVNGQAQGLRVLRAPSGKVLEEAEYRHGKRSGAYRTFDSEGRVLVAGAFSQDKRDGRWVHWRPDRDWRRGRHAGGIGGAGGGSPATPARDR